MTETPKKPSFEGLNRLCAPSTLLIILTGLFLYAGIFNSAFFVYLGAAAGICVFYLLLLSRRLKLGQAEFDLRVQNLREQANLLEAEIEHEQSASTSFQAKIDNYDKLKGMTERLSMCLYPDDTSRTLSAEVGRFFGDTDATIILYLFHSKTGELGISSSQKGQMRVNVKSKKGDEYDQWLVKTMHPLLIEDTKSDFRFDEEKIEREDHRPIRSLISVPLMVGNKALGILRIDSPKEDHFDTEDLRFLTTIGDLGAVAIENAQLYEHVERLAVRDSLTNLYLRRHLMERMPEEFSRQLRRKSHLSFMMIDLDKFKQYNDKFGHTAGDIVLRSVGLLLDQLFNHPGNMVCRYGGEEFAVLLPDCNKSEAVALAEQVRKKIAEQVIYLRREKTRVTVSIGVASFPKDAQVKEELIHKADQALYRAKEEGRDRVCAA